MTWIIRNTSDEIVMRSSDFGCYLLDVVDVTEGKTIGNFPSAIKSKVTSYDYSSNANRLYPIVIPKKVDNEGWRPVLENWSGATDTTFDVAWRQATGSSTNDGDGGYIVLVLGASDSITSGVRVKFWSDGGTNQYLSTNHCPMRYLSNNTVTVTGGSSNGATEPSTNGTAVLTDITFPCVVVNTTSSFSVTPGIVNNYTVWTGVGGTGGNASLYWFTSRIAPNNTDTGAKFITRDTSNRILVDSRSFYMRILDIQITSHTPNGLNGLTNNNTDLITFSNSVPATADGTYAIITNIGGPVNSIKMSNRTIQLQGQARIPSPVIAVAVHIGDI